MITQIIKYADLKENDFDLPKFSEEERDWKTGRFSILSKNPR